MQRQKFHMAIVTDEYGSVAGLVTLENLLEELVGDIADEHEHEVPRHRAARRRALPRRRQRHRPRARRAARHRRCRSEGWNTVGGLMFGLLGAIPAEGQSVAVEGYRLTAEQVQGRRVTRVLVSPEPA